MILNHEAQSLLFWEQRMHPQVCDSLESKVKLRPCSTIRTPKLDTNAMVKQKHNCHFEYMGAWIDDFVKDMPYGKH